MGERKERATNTARIWLKCLNSHPQGHLASQLTLSLQHSPRAGASVPQASPPLRAPWWPQVTVSFPGAAPGHRCPRLGPPKVGKLRVRRGARTRRRESAPGALFQERSRGHRAQRGAARHPGPGDLDGTPRAPTCRDRAIAPAGDRRAYGPTVTPGHLCPPSDPQPSWGPADTRRCPEARPRGGSLRECFKGAAGPAFPSLRPATWRTWTRCSASCYTGQCGSRDAIRLGAEAGFS